MTASANALRTAAVVRLRATLMANTPAGELLVAQRVVVRRQAAPSADASGGVRALTAATRRRTIRS